MIPRLAFLSVLAGLVASQAMAEGPYVVAHRGFLRHAPENTLANFRACLELRIGFEVDGGWLAEFERSRR